MSQLPGGSCDPGSKVTYANGAATLALVLSLTGVGIAGVRLAEDSVTTRELAENAVRNENIASGAVSFRNIAPKLRENLISILSARSDQPQQIAPGEFRDVLTRDVTRAGDSGQRLLFDTFDNVGAQIFACRSALNKGRSRPSRRP